jgi:hypothetical protein
MAKDGCGRVPRPLDLPDLAIADLCSLGWSKQRLAGRTLDSGQNVLETVTDVLSGLPKDDVNSAFLDWKERFQWVADQNGEFYKNQLNAQLRLPCLR